MEAFVFCINNKPVGGDHQHVPAATVFLHLFLSCQQLLCCNNTVDSFQSSGSFLNVMIQLYVSFHFVGMASNNTSFRFFAKK